MFALQGDGGLASGVAVKRLIRCGDLGPMVLSARRWAEGVISGRATTFVLALKAPCRISFLSSVISALCCRFVLG